MKALIFVGIVGYAIIQGAGAMINSVNNSSSIYQAKIERAIDQAK